MLHVCTDGPDNGLTQVFDRTGKGLNHVTASVWVYVERGFVTVTTGDSSHGVLANSATQGQWELVQVPDSGTPPWPDYQILVYSGHLSSSGACFDVDFASVQVNS